MNPAWSFCPACGNECGHGAGNGNGGDPDAEHERGDPRVGRARLRRAS